MAKEPELNLADYIQPLVVGGLKGRVLQLPPPKGHDREILFIYGQHSTIERWRGLSLVFNEFGGLTMPDIPGFGGMDTLYSVGKKPTMDNLADYLADFIRLRYKSNQHLNIAAMSIGFAMTTRMLQRHPDIAKRVDMLVSIVGFSHGADFVFSRRRLALYRAGSKVFSTRFGAWFFVNVFLQPAWLRVAYKHARNGKEKFADKTKSEQAATMEMEIALWHQNDLRTQMFTNLQMFDLDNTRIKLPLPVWHVNVEADRYFKAESVEAHYRMIFTDYQAVRSNVENHAPSVIADRKTAEPYLPPEIRRQLTKKRRAN